MAAKRVYKKIKCYPTRTAAKSAADKMRKSGKTAKVSGKCVLSAGARKTTRKTARKRK